MHDPYKYLATTAKEYKNNSHIKCANLTVLVKKNTFRLYENYLSSKVLINILFFFSDIIMKKNTSM